MEGKMEPWEGEQRWRGRWGLEKVNRGEEEDGALRGGPEMERKMQSGKGARADSRRCYRK